MRIVTLIENHRNDSAPALVAEHGLSLHIAHEGQSILFDTGASGAFSRNAIRLGVDLTTVDRVVLSHHHYDHGGGLETFLAANSHASIHLRRPPEGEPTVRIPGGMKRYIGLDTHLFERYADRFVFIDRFAEIAPEVFLLARIDQTYPRPRGNDYLYLRRADGYVHDPFRHELILAIREADGIVMFTGCSHSGALNMVRTVVERFPKVPIKAVVGGFHLIGPPLINPMGDTEAAVLAIGRELLSFPVERYYTGHCTGAQAYQLLRGVMGERLQGLSTGTVIIV